MKKIITIVLLSLTFIFALVGCGKKYESLLDIGHGQIVYDASDKENVYLQFSVNDDGVTGKVKVTYCYYPYGKDNASWRTTKSSEWEYDVAYSGTKGQIPQHVTIDNKTYDYQIVEGTNDGQYIVKFSEPIHGGLQFSFYE